MTAIENTSQDFGANSWLVEEMYAQFLDDPDAVSESWREFFSDFKTDVPAPHAAVAPAASTPAPAAAVAPAAAPAAVPTAAAPTGAPADEAQEGAGEAQRSPVPTTERHRGDGSAAASAGGSRRSRSGASRHRRGRGEAKRSPVPTT
jgi:2-oxoglutarate dehydrogenase complex dehydrogenase (E1) component-like enzyme